MANFNKTVLIGRLTRDPEVRTFANGGKVAKIGFAVSNRKKNSQTGQWEDEPMFIDVEVYNRGEYGKLADLVADRCRKGSQLLVEGKLHLDQWDDKNGGGKRSKHKIVAETIQLLDPKPGGAGGGGYSGGGGGYSGGSGGGGGYSGGGGGDYGGSGGSAYDDGAAASSSSSGGGDDIPF
jgi:single-strand DNA-binding protein